MYQIWKGDQLISVRFADCCNVLTSPVWNRWKQRCSHTDLLHLFSLIQKVWIFRMVWVLDASEEQNNLLEEETVCVAASSALLCFQLHPVNVSPSPTGFSSHVGRHLSSMWSLFPLPSLTLHLITGFHSCTQVKPQPSEQFNITLLIISMAHLGSSSIWL